MAPLPPEEKQSSPGALFLNGWNPLITRLLCEGGPHSFAILDHPVTLQDVDNNDDSVAECILRELVQNGMLDRWRPARTTSERKTDQLLMILSANPIASQTLGLALESTDTTTKPLRGDRCFFVPRQERSQRFPVLHQLIGAVEHTATKHLNHVFDFDLAKTSVQVAEYPGNGVAGYPRHCDRLHCAVGGTESATTTAERILTAIFYLNDADWDADCDGGALRLFHSASRSTDVTPYGNRLVLFRSDSVEHEVRPSCRRPRKAVTIWLYGRSRNEMPKHVQGRGPEALVKEDNAETRAKIDTTTPSFPPPLPLLKEDAPTNGESCSTIFVSIAAYRDSETGPTLRNLFAQALNPERVFVGLVLQVDTEHSYDRDFVLKRLPVDETWYRTQVRVVQMDAHHAAGPCPARALAQQLYRGETYALQLDSHHRFRENWDAFLTAQLQCCPNPDRALLTTYPVGYELVEGGGFVVPNNETRGTYLVPWKFDNDGMLRQKGTLMDNATTSPKLHHLFAAGFCFGPAHWMRTCPYDASLCHLFFGEEASMAARLYTHGFDLYAPTQSVCYHLWSRDHRPPPNDDKDTSKLETRDEARQRSQETVRQQMRGTGETGTLFGLGSKRSIQQWVEALGIVDFEKQNVTS